MSRSVASLRLLCGDRMVSGSGVQVDRETPFLHMAPGFERIADSMVVIQATGTPFYTSAQASSPSTC